MLRFRFVIATLWLAGLSAATPTSTWAVDAQPTDSIGQRMLACVACRGKDGVASPLGYFPRIAGKPAGYLYNQLVNFREGRRSNATMAYLLENLSDSYLREIAQYFSELDLPYADAARTGAAEESLRSRGQELVQRGDRNSNVPACASCHGTELDGDSAHIPALVGLRREYLLAQIGAWRTGLRRATEPDCMATVSRRLTASDLEALAAYLPSLPVGTSGRPHTGEAMRAKRPLDCGSVGP